MEQTSHHPPITNFSLEHYNQDYRIDGYFEEIFQQSGSTLEFRIKGNTVVEFKNGDKYSISWPTKIFEDYVFMKYEGYIRVEQLPSSFAATSSGKCYILI